MPRCLLGGDCAEAGAGEEGVEVVEEGALVVFGDADLTWWVGAAGVCLPKTR